MKKKEVTQGMRNELKKILIKVEEMLSNYEKKYGIRPKIVLTKYSGVNYDSNVDYQDILLKIEDEFISCLD